MSYSGLDAKLAEKIQNALTDRLGTGTAVSFSLVRDGKVICSASAGTCGESPCSTKDLFNIGSVSKTFCAAAVMKLCEMGKADLDTPVSAYLPNFVMADERYKKITLRMCLNHSSGLPGTMLKNSYSDRAGTCGIFRNDLFGYFSGTKLTAEPGTRSVYCNDGFDLASEVVSAVSGMPYTSFLNEYVAQPLAIVPIRSPENFDKSARHVCRKEFGEEFLPGLGSGGLAMCVEDVAKFGWEFLTPGKVLSAESAAETTASQQLAVDSNDSARNYGLGWDNVNFTCSEIDFGTGTLMKSGGTPSFVTYLLVCPKLQISAAISATRDIGCYVLPLFIELIALAMGVPLSGADRAEKTEIAMAEPVTQSIIDRYAGTYISSMNVHKVSFSEDRLTVKSMTDKGWQESVRPAPFNGSCFIGEYDGEPAQFSFSTFDGIDYLNVTDAYHGLSQIAEKPGHLSAANAAWTARNGKKYLIENGSKWDFAIGSMAAGIELKTFEDSGLVLALFRGLGAFNVIPAAASGDDSADMFLTATGGGTNQFSMAVSYEDGKEHFRCAGYSFIEAKAVPEYRGGEFPSSAVGTCLCFTIKEATILPPQPDGERIILVDKELHVVADSRVTGLPEKTGEGYMIVLRDA